jgi:hypothetical protein
LSDTEFGGSLTLRPASLLDVLAQGSHEISTHGEHMCFGLILSASSSQNECRRATPRLKSACAVRRQEFANETVPSCSGAIRSTIGGSPSRVVVQNALVGRSDGLASATVATLANMSDFKPMYPHAQAVVPVHRPHFFRGTYVRV